VCAAVHADAESNARRANLLHLADSAKIHSGAVCELPLSSESHDTSRLMRSRPRSGRTNSSARTEVTTQPAGTTRELLGGKSCM